MTSANKITKEIIKNYKKIFVFSIFFIRMITNPTQAMEEVVYVHSTNSAQFKTKLESYNADTKKEAILTRQYKEDDGPEPIQYISEKTKFRWNSKDIQFPLSHSPFLEKVWGLSLDPADYNHLCLTLYAVYEENGSTQVVESPLFAQKREKAFILNNEGVLQKDTTVEFYTKANPGDDQWAYFVTHNGGSKAVNDDQSIFPISSRSYMCEKSGCNAICKNFYEHDIWGKCQHSRNACRHTEPHALFHLKKHATELFAPFIIKAHGVKNIKSIGIRFFSYYQPCSECVAMLHGNRSISISEEKSFKSSLIFYFTRTYLPVPVIKINDDQHQLYNSSIFCGFIKDGSIHDSYKEAQGKNLGCINLAETVNLAEKGRIFLIQWFDNFNVSDAHCYKIYYY